MKYKHVIIASVLFFLLINTQYLWEGQTGMFGLPILIIYYIILIGKFIQYVYVSFKEKWKIRQRNIALGVICFVLIITAMFPFGIIPYHKFEQNVFV
ncbi:MAG: hypothetical protein LBR55_06720, partial [Bacteroidales bacterium]|nr:hypothetical protein [Bacteroidales bacterium]